MEIDLPQIITAGIYNSQFAIKNKEIKISKNRKTTMFEIEIPIEKGGVSYINSDYMSINTDMVICVKPGQIRHTMLPFKCYYIHMILPEGDLKNRLCEVPNYFKTEKYARYLSIFKQIHKYYDTSLENDEIILQSFVLKLIHLLLEDSKNLSFSHCSKNNNHIIIKNIINYIKNNLTSDLSLETLSKKAGFSPIYFHNCFKASTGLTLRAFVEEQRIKKAANMLISTNDTLTKISYNCGFSSQSYFSYAFKRKTNLTPREYARKVFEQYTQKK